MVDSFSQDTSNPSSPSSPSNSGQNSQTIYVRLAIRTDELLKLYRGSARAVSATAVDGRSIRFPADALKPFVSRDGVYGSFALQIDRNNKLLAIHRRGD